MFVGLVGLHADKVTTQSATVSNRGMVRLGFDRWCITTPGIPMDDSIYLLYTTLQRVTLLA